MLYQQILDNIVNKCKELFQANLTGVYLHGSMAMGCFNPEKSDIDLLIVVENDITDEQKMEFMKEVIEQNKLAPEKGIELSIVKKAYCNKFVYPTPFELHFSRAHLQWFYDNPVDYIQKMKGTDKDLAAHFTIIKKYGLVLYGMDIEKVFGNVPKEDYIDSIMCDIEEADEEILENPVYIILNLCRVAAFLKDGAITSKKQGGEWGEQNLDSQYHKFISEALKCYESGNEMMIDKVEAQKFTEYMMQIIKMCHE